jgi:hypothetical protein
VECRVKKNPIESLGHTFLVENIKEELLKHTKEVKTYITKEPDIVFKNNKGKMIALEIETGMSYKKNKKELKKKFEELQKKYGKNLMIILTDKKFKTQYQKNFPDTTVLLRKDIQQLITANLDHKGKT